MGVWHMYTQHTSTPHTSPATLLPYPHTLPHLLKPYTGEYGAVMTHLQIGNLYKHIDYNHVHVLTEISKSCVHLWNFNLGCERTIRNDVFKSEWERIGDDQ